MPSSKQCEIKTAFIVALGDQYKHTLTKGNELCLKYDLCKLRDTIENLGIKDGLTSEDMEEIICNKEFLTEIALYSDIEDIMTASEEPDADKIKDIVQQWALVANIIRTHEEAQGGSYEYPEDFVLSSPGTQGR